MQCTQHPFSPKSGTMLVHRLVMESYLGRYLTKDEVVHHKSEIKTDNRITNLQVMTKSDHRKLHMINPYNSGVVKHQDKLNEIIHLRKSGLYASEIAERLNIPRRSIQRYLSSNNLGGQRIKMSRRLRDANGRFV